MAIKISSSIVINDSREVTLGGLNSDPGGVSAGAIHFNRGLGVVRGWNGTSWTNLTQGAGTTELWSWGYDANGRLGINTNSVHRSSPVLVHGNFTDWTTVDAGNQHVVGIRNGIAFSWGNNSNGELGFDNTASRSSPTSVVGGFTDWVQVSAGQFHTAGVRANGTAWCWGLNNIGAIGSNDIVTRSSPTSVVGGFTNWTQISAGNEFTMALRSNGELFGWGSNGGGQLGNNQGAFVHRSSPTSVVGGFTDWVQVSAGGSHTAALRGNGTAWTWGANASGQLGNYTTVGRSSPVQVVGGFTDWTQISAAQGGSGGVGGYHTAGIRSNGTAWCWGNGVNGTLGNDSGSGNRSSPVSVVGGFTDWAQISAGNDHTTAVRLNGTAWCWGRNGKGQLGINDTVNRSSPVSVVGSYTDWVTISAGGQGTLGGHTFAIRATTQ